MGVLPVLEVAIGLAFVYLLLALIVTTITEWIARLSDGRGRMLESGIRRLVGDDRDDSGMTQEVLRHPLIQSMSRTGRRPSYIPSRVFAQALTDVVQQRRLPASSAAIPEPLTRSLKALQTPAAPNAADHSDGSLPDSETLAEWYDYHMERVSGWYKRHALTVALIASIALTVAANADTVSLGRRLWTDSALRTTVVDAAKNRIALGPPLQTVEYIDPTTPKPTKPIDEPEASSGTDAGDANHLSAAEQALLGGMMGWAGERGKLKAQGWVFWLLYHIVGWLITALAVSLGAPFWFDTLNRFVNIRAAGPRPESTVAARTK